MRKRFAIALIFILVALSATSALAHGSHHGRQRTVSHALCATQDCTQTGLHRHDSGIYAAHYYGDGHDYHAYCAVEDCAAVGYHAHDGVYCFGRPANAGGYRSGGRCH